MADVQGHPRITRTNGGAPGSAYTPVGLDVAGKANGPHRAGDLNVDVAGPYLQIATADGTPGTYKDLIAKKVLLGAVGIQRLAYGASSDLWSNVALSAGWNANAGSDPSFTVGTSNSLIVVTVIGGPQVATNSSPWTVMGIAFDASGSVGTPLLIGTPVINISNNCIAGGGTRIVNNLSAGTHTVGARIWVASAVASGYYWRPVSVPNIEPYIILVHEIQA